MKPQYTPQEIESAIKKATKSYEHFGAVGRVMFLDDEDIDIIVQCNGAWKPGDGYIYRHVYRRGDGFIAWVRHICLYMTAAWWNWKG